MKIGSIDIAMFEAKQQRVSIDHATINNNSEWAAGSTTPYFEKNRIGMKPISVELLVKGSGREEIMHHCSDILALLLDEVELTLDGYRNKFRAILKSHSRTETSMRRWHVLKLEFEGYEHGEEVPASGTSSVMIHNPGNLVSPCQVEIVPRVGAASIVLSGICRDSYTGQDLPVTIKDLEAGRKVVLNGLSGLITQDGELKEVDMWTLPCVAPGDTLITCNNDWMDMSVYVTPLYA